MLVTNGFLERGDLHNHLRKLGKKHMSHVLFMSHFLFRLGYPCQIGQLLMPAFAGSRLVASIAVSTKTLYNHGSWSQFRAWPPRLEPAPNARIHDHQSILRSLGMHSLLQYGLLDWAVEILGKSCSSCTLYKDYLELLQELKRKA